MYRLRFLLVISAFLWVSGAEAVDLANRLGVGYTNQMSEDLPSITARYYPNSRTGFSISLGVDTEKDNSKFGVLAKIYRVVFTEDNMNFYVGGGAGILSVESPLITNPAIVDNNSGFEMMGFLGGEFFFSGLESLGFTFEAGVGIRSDTDGTRFRTIGDHPLRGGIIFYF